MNAARGRARRGTHSLRLVFAAAFGLAFAAAAEGGDPAAGRAKAKICATCHGPLGVSRMPGTPHLAGQPAIYVAAQLRAFRSGQRRHEQMNVVAKPLSDADIEDLAAWFESIELSAKEPAR
ncbi:MAG TPA: c-type cytochrome [Burkholderiales bacterium]